MVKLIKKYVSEGKILLLIKSEHFPNETIYLIETDKFKTKEEKDDLFLLKRFLANEKKLFVCKEDLYVFEEQSKENMENIFKVTRDLYAEN